MRTIRAIFGFIFIQLTRRSPIPPRLPKSHEQLTYPFLVLTQRFPCLDLSTSLELDARFELDARQLETTRAGLHHWDEAGV